MCVRVFLAPSLAPLRLSSPAEAAGDLQSLLSHYTWQRSGTGQRHVHMCKLKTHTHLYSYKHRETDRAGYHITFIVFSDCPGVKF